MLGKVTVIAVHRAKPGKEDALRQALLALCGPTREEKGCLNYDLHVSADDPGPAGLPRELDHQGGSGQPPCLAPHRRLPRRGWRIAGRTTQHHALERGEGLRVACPSGGTQLTLPS